MTYKIYKMHFKIIISYKITMKYLGPEAKILNVDNFCFLWITLKTLFSAVSANILFTSSNFKKKSIKSNILNL